MAKTTVDIQEAVLGTAPLPEPTFDELTVCRMAAASAVTSRGKIACDGLILAKENRKRKRLKTYAQR